MLEEAIFTLRGQWPAAATGMCMTVNSLFGFTLTGRRAKQEIVDENAAEALRLLEALYGESAVTEVYPRANPPSG